MQLTWMECLLYGLKWATSLVALNNPVRSGTLVGYTLQLREVGVQPNHSQYQTELVWKESNSKSQTPIHKAGRWVVPASGTTQVCL